MNEFQDTGTNERQARYVGGIDPTPRSIYGDRPTPSLPPRPSAKHRALIGELGLRYRPTSRADIEAHAAGLALLAVDLADIPPPALEMAIRQWAVSKPFMPKACELAELAKRLAAPPSVSARLPLAEQAAARNAALDAEGNFRVRWIIGRDGQWQAVGYEEWRRAERERIDGAPATCTPAEARAILAQLHGPAGVSMCRTSRAA